METITTMVDVSIATLIISNRSIRVFAAKPIVMNLASPIVRLNGEAHSIFIEIKESRHALACHLHQTMFITLHHLTIFNLLWSVDEEVRLREFLLSNLSPVRRKVIKTSPLLLMVEIMLDRGNFLNHDDLT
jgi:hypothetical protein